MKLACRHRIPLSADAFWQVIHAPRYEALVGEEAGLHAYRELERRDEGDAIYRRIHAEPELPAALGALVSRFVPRGATPSYVEEQWRSKSRKEVRFRMHSSFLPRSRIEGVVRVEPLDAESCTRILDGVVEVGLFGVGRLIERAVVANTIEAYAKSAAAVKRL